MSSVQGAGGLATEQPAELTIEMREDRSLVLKISGVWSLTGLLPHLEPVWQVLQSEEVRRIHFETSELVSWDSSVVTALTRLIQASESTGIHVDRSGLPAGVRQLLQLAEAVPEREGAKKTAEAREFLEKLGDPVVRAWDATSETLEFLGEVVHALWAFVRRKARYRKADIRLLIQQAGAEALGIVTLVSFLLGLILAFVAAVQLAVFGAQIYVANLVGVAMVRDMAALMTGIIMAGRSGAAYAAQLGTMKVTQELDALATMGISPIEFLVVPRIIALTLMMPLLTVYADVVGVLGGAVVAITMLDLSPSLYFSQTIGAVGLKELIGGIFKAGVYGGLVAVAGSLRGMQSGKSASAVGDAATSAVVTGIVAIIAACGLFAWLFYVLGL